MNVNIPPLKQKIILVKDESGKVIETEQGILTQIIKEDGSSEYSFIKRMCLDKTAEDLKINNSSNKSNDDKFNATSFDDSIHILDENDVENINEPSTSTKWKNCVFVAEGHGSIANWSENETKMMLKFFTDNQNDFGPFHKFKNKRKMWESISGKLLAEKIHRSPIQCETRYKTLINKRNEVRVHNRTSGNQKRFFEFEEEFQLIQINDDSVEPEVHCGVGEYKCSSKATVNREEPARKKKENHNIG